MDKAPHERLTAVQRSCLRLVSREMKSKDIARELGISPNTVDQRIRVAMQVLGASTRLEAARLLDAAEKNVEYQLIPQSPDLAGPAADRVTDRSHNEAGRELHNASRKVLAEQQAGFTAASKPSEWAMSAPFPTAGRRWNDLGTMKRFGWIALIAAGSAMSFGALLAGLDALSHLL